MKDPPVRQHTKLWVEALLRSDEAGELTQDELLRLARGDYSSYVVSNAAVPMQEITSFAPDESSGAVPLTKAMPVIIGYLMLPDGVLTERPFNVGDIVHVCMTTRSKRTGKARLSALDIILLPAGLLPDKLGDDHSITVRSIKLHASAADAEYAVAVLKPAHSAVSYTKRIET